MDAWFPSLTTAAATSALFAGVLYLARNFIITRLTAAVTHEFNAKLEKLKAELQASEAQLDALRRGALSALEQRNGVLDKRRLEAADKLWGAVVALAPARLAAAWLIPLKFKATADELKSRSGADLEKFRTIFAPLIAPLEKLKGSPISAKQERPFVSQDAWATFSVYESILSMAVIKGLMLAHAAVDVIVLKEDELNKLVKSALPHQSDFIDKFPETAVFHLLDELEVKLIRELRLMIVDGFESDQQKVERAAEIVKASESVRAALAQARAQAGRTAS